MPQHGVTTITQTSPHVSTQANTTGSMTEFLQVQTPAGKRFTYPAGHPIEMFVMTHEQFTTDNTAGNDQTFTLSNDLVNSPALADADTSQTSGGAEVDSSGQADLVVYDGGTQKAVVSVDYSANSFVYADAGTGSTLDVYYVWKDSGLIEGRWYKANEEAYEQVFGTTPGELHASATYNRNEQLTFSRGFDAGPKDKVKFFIDTAVDLTNWDAFSGGGPNSTSSFATFRLPVIPRDIPGGPPGRSDIANRGGPGRR